MIEGAMTDAEGTTSTTASRPTPRRDVPLVPRDAIAARALVTVIAIMTFLASLTAGAAILVGDASSGWRRDVAREMTIQVKPLPGRNLDLDVRRVEEAARNAAGVEDVRAFSQAESEKLLEPWLGAGLDLSQLPVPRMILMRLAPDGGVDVEALRHAVAQASPGAILDDHKVWIERLGAMAGAMVVVAGIILLLVLVAMALAVAFATRGAMAGSREVINVLHFVGAKDAYIARQFQRHFLWLGLRGGLIGGCAAIAAFLAAGALSSRWIAAAQGEQVQAMFGAFSLGPAGYLAVIAITGSVALLTGFTSRSVVFRHLQGLE
jgi:cell division transport system permease protein